MDTQTIEIIGRNRLINELLEAGMEVALPLRDRGIDLIAYADSGSSITAFVAFPIQMKASSKRHFSIDKKYEKFPNLIHAFVWGISLVAPSMTFALTYPEAVEIGNQLGWTKTISWQRGAYNTQKPSKELIALLEPYRMTREAWKQTINNLLQIFQLSVTR